MAGCNCKTNNYKTNQKSLNNTLTKNKTNIILRIIAFSLGLLFLPIIMLAVIWFMFELLMLNKEVDMKKIVTVLSSKIKPFNEDYEDYEYEEDDEFTEENYEMLDVEEITPITSK
jgi:hypothetical protein